MNSVKIEFEGLNFEGYIGKVIVEEFNKCKKEFKDQLSLAPCDIKLSLISDFLRSWNDDIRYMKGHLSRERLYKYFKEESERINPMLQTDFGGYRDKKNNVMIVDTLKIMIYEDRLNHFVVSNLDNLDIVIKTIQQGIRHEIGHIIDFIRYHKMDFDKYRTERDIREEARAKYYEEFRGESSIDNLRKYYELEEEAVANANVGISLEDKLKYDIMLSKIDRAKLKTTLTITSEYESLKEDDGDGEREQRTSSKRSR